VWLDDSQLGYFPYHDRVIYPSVDQQLGKWGKLAEWSDFHLYEWVKSTVPPEEYSDLVAEQEGDISIEPGLRASGTPRQALYRNTGGSNWEVYNESQLHWQTISGANGYTDTFVADVYNDQQWNSTDLINVYVDGSLVASDITLIDVPPSITIDAWVNSFSGVTTVASSSVHITRNVDHLIDEGSYKYDYTFITMDRVSANGTTVDLEYYFWVSDRATHGENQALSIRDAEAQLKIPNITYQVFRKTDAEFAAGTDSYTQIIVRRVNEVIKAEDRYQLRFTRNFTLRDTINDEIGTNTAGMLKNVHDEWTTFRKDQPSHIPRELWDLVTASIMGFELVPFDNGELIPVPTLDRVLYDESNGTTTRLGTSPGQAFVDGTKALRTILDVIQSPDFDTYPADKFYLLENSDFETPGGKQLAMETIYNSFPNDNVNHLFFEVLQDAFADKVEYPDLFKTSWIAVHGIKVLETAGNVNEI
jgi:hypothetical protein